jgi:hypothetical protein
MTDATHIHGRPRTFGPYEIIVSGPNNEPIAVSAATASVGAALIRTNEGFAFAPSGSSGSGVPATSVGAGTVNDTEFGFLDGVTSPIQTQLDGKAATVHTHAGTDITSGTINVARLPTAIPATSIGGGTVDNTEFAFLNGVTSSIQTQLDGKAATSHSHAGTDISSGTIDIARLPTAIPATSIGGGIVNDTEFAFLDGVTSAIQTQLDSKAATAHTHAGIDITSGTINVARLPSAIPAINIGGGAVDDTEFAFLNGVTSAIQTQLNSKAAASHTHAATDIGAGTVDNTEFGHLNGVTSAIQTQLDGKAATSHTHAGTDITSGTINVGRLPTGIPATSIGGGTVDNTEFSFVNGVTSAIQTQLDGKAATSHSHDGTDITSGTINVGRLPTGIPATSIGGGAVDNTEFAFLNGVTSAIQTQLDGKAATSHTHAATDIGAGTVDNTEFGHLNGVTSAIQTQLNSKAASSHTHAATDIGAGTVDNTEFGHLNGVTSAIQTQLDGKAATSHTHAGTDITSGTINVARLPTAIPATSIGGGAVDNTEFAFLDGVTSAIQTQIDGKSSTSHTHTLDNLSDVNTSGVADGNVLSFNSGSSTWVPTAPSGGGSVFGTAFETAASSGATTNSTTTFNTKVSLTTSSGNEAGTYMLMWTAYFGRDNSDQEVMARFVVDGSTVLEYSVKPLEERPDHGDMFTGFVVQSLTAGSHTLSITFATSVASTTARISNAVIAAYRVS